MEFRILVETRLGDRVLERVLVAQMAVMLAANDVY
jgi:hypothetical protein